MKVVSALFAFVHIALGANPKDLPVSTGQDLAVGTSDPYWTTSFGGSKPVSAQAGSSEYWKTFSGYANWITAPPPSNGQPYAAGDYTFSTSFDIVKQNPDKYFLTATVAADDQVQNITVNGHAIVMGKPCADSEIYCTNEYVLSDYFVAGTNTISFVTNNHAMTGLNPVGLWVEFSVGGSC